jgi:hypothetical protein
MEIGISVSKFRTLVKDNRMPRPPPHRRQSGGDVDELRIAFKALPHEGDRDGTDSWADVV